MGKGYQSWKPDTCDCELHFEYDDTLPADRRVLTPVDEYVSPNGVSYQTEYCDAHKQSDSNTVLRENRTKNHALEELAKLHPELAVTVKDDNGRTTKQYDPDKVKWSFDNNRNLKLEAQGLDKKAINDAVSDKLGKDKVQVV